VQLSIIIFQADGGTGWAARNRLYDLADRSTGTTVFVLPRLEERAPAT
jgi:hypothetical protein